MIQGPELAADMARFCVDHNGTLPPAPPTHTPAHAKIPDTTRFFALSCIPPRTPPSPTQAGDQYIKDDSLLIVSSRRLTIVTNPPLNLTISRERIQDYRLQQPAEYFQSLTPVPTIMRSEFIYPDAALEYFLSD